MTDLVIYPALVMVALTGVVTANLAARRIKAVQDRRVRAQFYLAQRTDEEPEPLHLWARHYSNLFELTVLFYFWVAVVLATESLNMVSLSLAWVFVASRVVHSIEHVTRNRLPVRLSLFLFGYGVLMAIWVSWGVGFLG